MTCKCGGKMAVEWQPTSIMAGGRLETPAIFKCEKCGEQAATVAEGYLLKADTPNANGDVFSADALREFSMGCSVKISDALQAGEVMLVSGEMPRSEEAARAAVEAGRVVVAKPATESRTMYCDACGSQGQGARLDGWRSFPPGWLVSEAPSDFLLVCSVACALGVNR